VNRRYGDGFLGAAEDRLGVVDIAALCMERDKASGVAREAETGEAAARLGTRVNDLNMVKDESQKGFPALLDTCAS